MNYIIFPIFEKEGITPEISCKFKLRLDDVIDIYDREIKHNEKICSGLPKDAPRHKEFEAIKRLRDELNESLNLKVDREYNSSEYIAVFVSRLIFNKKFESVYCRKCSAEYKPKDVSVQSWSRGESFYAEGGRTVSCKNGHHLFEMMQWNS